MVTLNRLWKESELEIVNKSIENSTFILVAIDTQEAAVVSNRNPSEDFAEYIFWPEWQELYSGSKKTQSKHGKTFLGEVVATSQTILTSNITNQNVIMFGPEETKRRFHNFFSNQMEIMVATK